ncbi:3'(2'),5'-bisphosphate nucleotidase [Pasteurella langaaensis DSM 22999]|uniref:3'(2'),5'-bisphosphate nucleotidase CysQ n=1 Tax=Alitibacter langaaensis DSM 22999 TaxID=1122935 RepID=A0A2U0SL79_9PAST|nr:3'(2'),5'-bisphosphate nucleotidase CysQ [Pasteurella langaaensis]PVX32116.1 3'(2'),5'-bisphosphate nucleotidase [Pasteurella langaaensis DSM 22999]
MPTVSLSDSLLQSVLAIAQQAGEHIRAFYAKSVKIHTKSDNTPVTEADLFVSQFLIEKLIALTPDIPVLSEENCETPLKVRSKWAQYWLIDPLDGTQQFINRTGQFSVMIALVEHNQPVLGVICAPILDCSYYAMKGFGAFKQTQQGVIQLVKRNIDLNGTVKIIVGSEKKIPKVRSFLNPNFHYEFQVFGSSGLKGARVAEGIADCYVRLGNTGEWDTAAAQVILHEINGTIFDRTFAPLSYNQRETFTNPDFIMVADEQINWENIFQTNTR